MSELGTPKDSLGAFAKIMLEIKRKTRGFGMNNQPILSLYIFCGLWKKEVDFQMFCKT